MKVLTARSIPVVAILFASATASICLGGDLEHWVFRPMLGCPGQRLESAERWTSTSTPLPWVVRIDNVNSSILPGLPPCGGGSATNAPGFKPLQQAVDEWNDFPIVSGACGAVIPLPPCPASNPPSQPAVSTLHFATSPTFTSATPATVLVNIGPDTSPGSNVVSFLEPPAVFAGAGGTFLLAVAVVRASGTIPTDPFTDFDIAFNARATDTAGNVLWSWVHEDATGPFASFIGGAFTPPVTGYVDVQGVFTHELGHAAGLGHTAIDGQIGLNPSGAIVNHVPTMFAEGQIEPFNVLVRATSCATSGTIASNGPGTTWGGILGRAARTLEQDDIAAIGRAYPTQCFPLWTGTITGRALNNLGVGVPGLTVVAISRDCPNDIRVSTLTYGIPGDTGIVPQPGTYTLSGLPSGYYYVYIEDVDQPVWGDSSAGGRYFSAQSDVPNYIISGAVCAVWPCPRPRCIALNCPGCLTNCAPGVKYSGVREWGFCSQAPVEQRLSHEFWNVNDSGNDVLQQVNYIRVGPGAAVAGVDFVIQPESPPDLRLEVRSAACPSCVPSRRGFRATATDIVEIAIVGPASLVGNSVQVQFAFNFQNQIRNGQLFQLPIFPACTSAPLPSVPGCTSGVLVPGPGGSAELRFNVNLSTFTNVLFQNVHAQAIVTTAGGEKLTNPVNIWVRLP